MNSPEIFVENRFERHAIDLIIKHDGAFVNDLTFVVKEDHEIAPVALTLSETEAQALIDRLWVCGFRPSEGSGSAGALAAVQYHLEDMRKLVFQDNF